MPISRQKKEELVKELQEKLKEAKSSVFANFDGLTVTDLDNLRAQMREKGAEFKVIKKTLIKIAAKDAGYENIPDSALEGPIGVAIGMEDAISAAKILHTFAKKNDNMKLRGALFEGRVLSAAETQELAVIPSKEELIAKLVYLLNSPIQGFHGVLNNTVAGFVRVLNAIKEKQEQGS